jgi:hypothetical protein
MALNVEASKTGPMLMKVAKIETTKSKTNDTT